MNRLLAGWVSIFLLTSTCGAWAVGLEWLVRFETNQITSAEGLKALQDQLPGLVESRLRVMGLTSYSIELVEPDRLVVQVAGLDDGASEAVRRMLQRRGMLEFRMVYDKSAEYLAQGLVPPGYTNLTETRINRDGSKTLVQYLVNKKAERGLTGEFIQRAFVGRNPLTDEPEIQFELDAEGAQLFAEITREHQPVTTAEGESFRQLAIVLDGELYSAPRIMGPIEGGRGMITGRFTAQEAFELAHVLENPFPVSFSLLEERSLDAGAEKMLRLKEAASSPTALVLRWALVILIVGFAIYMVLRSGRGQGQSPAP